MTCYDDGLGTKPAKSLGYDGAGRLASFFLNPIARMSEMVLSHELLERG